MLRIARTCCRPQAISSTRQLLASTAQKGRRWSSNGNEGGRQENQLDHAVVFSGIQPTGIPHLGNYLGALRQWKRLQDMAGEKDELYFSIVDLHAITMPQDAESLRLRRREMLAVLLAIGMDPKRSTMFYQSSVTQHSELMWILSCTASMGYLGRMTQYKSKIMSDNKQGSFDEAMHAKLKLGLFSYPVLQAADILVHRATHVPVGDDQRQHLEFARECVTNFNHTYKQDIFIYPQTITTQHPRVMSLQNPYEKMSKSSTNERSRILLSSSPQEIRSRIIGAVTDGLGAITYDPERRPGVSNLLELAAQCSPESTTPEFLAAQLKGASPSELKELCIKFITAELEGVHERYLELFRRAGGKYLDEIEAEGAEIARRNAEETMRLVRSAVGLAGVSR
ncbi:tryptophanyl-tRNA synthetase [Xylaria nigripes]|nr:tryptophanyl-tRNA synthetase [Xylaria nigripes]